MDGAWAFWQHCCRSRWQLPTQATRESIMGRQRGTERDVVRERERRSRSSVLEVLLLLLPRERVAKLGNANRPRSSALCPPRPFPLDSVWRLQGAASRYPRDLCRANCTAVNNNRARLPRPPLSNPFLPWFWPPLLSMGVDKWPGPENDRLFFEEYRGRGEFWRREEGRWIMTNMSVT